ncbi:hypothetical protein EVAR_54226_1 [Eumeta japonica]|uniref:Uncharacterized protein n=1 Tax=Eumeta variegata TaxID=151549 RepID=A0A4C1YWF2_EUMVA|nr:hypothetical protein EVAR_54226_1 [Eumeta japonica]
MKRSDNLQSSDLGGAQLRYTRPVVLACNREHPLNGAVHGSGAEWGDGTHHDDSARGEEQTHRERGVVAALLGVVVRLPRAARHGHLVHAGRFELTMSVVAPNY